MSPLTRSNPRGQRGQRLRRRPGRRHRRCTGLSSAACGINGKLRRSRRRRGTCVEIRVADVSRVDRYAGSTRAPSCTHKQIKHDDRRDATRRGLFASRSAEALRADDQGGKQPRRMVHGSDFNDDVLMIEGKKLIQFAGNRLVLHVQAPRSAPI